MRSGTNGQTTVTRSKRNGYIDGSRLGWRPVLSVLVIILEWWNVKHGYPAARGKFVERRNSESH
jgi:hypothetical protein